MTSPSEEVYYLIWAQRRVLYAVDWLGAGRCDDVMMWWCLTRFTITEHCEHNNKAQSPSQWVVVWCGVAAQVFNIRKCVLVTGWHWSASTPVTPCLAHHWLSLAAGRVQNGSSHCWGSLRGGGWQEYHYQGPQTPTALLSSPLLRSAPTITKHRPEMNCLQSLVL